MLILTQNIYHTFSRSTQKERIEAEKMKTSSPVAAPAMPTAVATPLAVVLTTPSVDPSLSMPTSAMARPLPEL